MELGISQLGSEAFDPFLASISRLDTAEKTGRATESDSLEFADSSGPSRSEEVGMSALDVFPERALQFDSLRKTLAKSPFVSDHGSALFDSIYQTW